jgi:hypothetical protein
VRCPGCRNLLGGDFSSRHPALNASAVLGDVKGYKPALSRVSAWWHDYARRGLAAGVVPCFNCGGPAKVMLRPPGNIHPTLRDIRGIFMACPSCGKSTIYSAVGYALASPAVQAFWRKHPRMRALPDGEVRWQNRPGGGGPLREPDGRRAHRDLLRPRHPGDAAHRRGRRRQWDVNAAEAGACPRVDADHSVEESRFLILGTSDSREATKDDLRPEYDFRSLRVVARGRDRGKPVEQIIHLAPDVAEMFPDSASVNEALRFLIRAARGRASS